MRPGRGDQRRGCPVALYQESTHQALGGTISPHSTQIGESTKRAWDGQLVTISVPRYSLLRGENPGLSTSRPPCFRPLFSCPFHSVPAQQVSKHSP